MIEYFSKGSNGLYLVTFGLSVELVGQRFKAAVGMLFGLPYSIGQMVLGATVVFLRDWRTLHMVFGGATLALLALIPFIPESPRWLIATGKYDRAEKCLDRAAKANKVNTPKGCCRFA